MTTYTLVFCNDLLLVATVPDGGDIEAAVKAEEKNGNVEFNEDDLTYYKGVTLTDDPEDDDEIIYSGTSCGWLIDEAGTAYEYAVWRDR